MSIYVCNECGGSLIRAYSNNYVPTREGFTLQVKCKSCSKRFTLFLDLNGVELRRRETRPNNVRARKMPEKYRPKTLCWHCQKACGGPSGCSWFNGFKPIEGWEAIPETMRFNGIHDGQKSYTVIKCPEFEEDKKRAGA